MSQSGNQTYSPESERRAQAEARAAQERWMDRMEAFYDKLDNRLREAESSIAGLVTALQEMGRKQEAAEDMRVKALVAVVMGTFTLVVSVVTTIIVLVYK